MNLHGGKGQKNIIIGSSMQAERCETEDSEEQMDIFFSIPFN
jgi:hypothetical protein